MGDTKIGIIASGIAYQYAREAFGDGASYLKLGMVYPLPVRLIEDFASKVDKLYVIEELDDIFETHSVKEPLISTSFLASSYSSLKYSNTFGNVVSSFLIA
jgi:TPP-dependent indolepyruvate ferredoxin oxidoreductase alpha subunit